MYSHECAKPSHYNQAAKYYDSLNEESSAIINRYLAVKILHVFQTLQVYRKTQLRDMLEKNGFKVMKKCDINGGKFHKAKTERLLTIAKNGKITAVVDFGCSGIGDPAVDLMVAWSLLTQDTRQIFRTVVAPDDATWERARGWVVFLGVVAYPYYVNSNPEFTAIAKAR